MIIRVTPPVDYPVTITGARDFLQVTDTTDDHTINMLIGSAVEYCEGYMQQALMPRTIVESYRTWPCNFLRWNPVLEVVDVKYYDEDNVLQTYDAANYEIDHRDAIAYVRLRTDVTFPTVYDRADAIQITYRAGYEPYGSIPASLYHAVLLELRHAYDFRTNEKLDSSPYRIASERLMNNHIVYTYRI